MSRGFYINDDLLCTYLFVVDDTRYCYDHRDLVVVWNTNVKKCGAAKQKFVVVLVPASNGLWQIWPPTILGTGFAIMESSSIEKLVEKSALSS